MTSKHLTPLLFASLFAASTAHATIEKERCMSVMYYRLNEDFAASDVIRWYDKATMGETVIIALPAYPSVRLYRRPNERVYWYTEGGRGMTVSLEDARQRLAMFQTRWGVEI